MHFAPFSLGVLLSVPSFDTVYTQEQVHVTVLIGWHLHIPIVMHIQCTSVCMVLQGVMCNNIHIFSLSSYPTHSMSIKSTEVGTYPGFSEDGRGAHSKYGEASSTRAEGRGSVLKLSDCVLHHWYCAYLCHYLLISPL
jgi:hypothetical protein